MAYIPRLCLAGVLMGSAFTQSAVAQTSTTSFDVTITITNACVIGSATDLDFGSVGILETNVDAYSEIAVTCTEGADYAIALDAGQGQGTTAERVMTNATNTVSYQLYTDEGRATVWGDTPGDDAVSGTGTGSEQYFNVYGRVLPQNTPPAATYTDTVGVTVSF